MGKKLLTIIMLLTGLASVETAKNNYIHDITRKGRDYKFWVGLSAGFQLN